MQGLGASLPVLLLLLLLSAQLPPPAVADQLLWAPGVEQALDPSSRLAVGAARVALHKYNFQAASPSGLRALGQVRKATMKSIPGMGQKYYLQFTTEDYRSRENAGSCLATVLYPKKKSPPAVNIKCINTKDQKQIQEEDNRLYQKLKRQTKPIIGSNIPDSFGIMEPAFEPVWALAVAGSSYMMWEKSTEKVGYFMSQVKTVKQWMRKDDSLEFDYTILLHEMPTQEMILCHMRLIWLPGRPLKVKYTCESDSHRLEDGSGMESGSAAGIIREREENF
ncbi:retinoic acid receptor responder protein 1 [Anas platyrhynchos]|uniref:Retinoic acid receptor responder 1 n=1 Tax=Anas platyrhynchos platyrhynchos TaxID=8840 RepID=U3ICL6_ANAPP|nr:LOW QUALITY PROTEIN: retinoic acid receptor responder protein 1 [Anas platyrhynchos]|eukprot:XP_027319708.1 retinoic acid receptor responder protein 1 [Anas platyrhynchos]